MKNLEHMHIKKGSHMKTICNSLILGIIILLSFLSLGCQKKKAWTPRSIKAPQTLVVQPGDRQVTLSWKTSTNSGKKTITSHQYRKKVGTGAYGKWMSIPNSGQGKSHETSFIVTKLTNGTSYTFQVRAINSGGHSAPSNAVTATPRAAAPTAPTGLTANPRSGAAYLIWTASGSPGSSSIIKHQYRMKAVANNGSYKSWTDIPSSAPGQTNATSFTMTGLTNGATYTFQLRAVNRTNNSLPSNEATVTTSDTTQPPTAPRNFTAHPRDKAVLLAWGASSSDGGSLITKHQYQKKQGSGNYGNWTDIPNSAPGETNATSFTLTGLTNGTSYTFQVRATNHNNNTDYYSPASSPVTTTPMVSAQKPEAPTNLTAHSRNAGAYLTWTIGSNGGSPITKHQYRKKQGTNGVYDNWEDIPSSASGETNVTSFTVIGLNNRTTYTFQVRAKNSEGYSLVSNVVTVTPGAVEAPTAPRGLTANPRSGAAYLIWTASGSPGSSSIIKHQYRMKAVANNGSYKSWTDILSSAPGQTNATNFTVPGLTNGATYIFQVRAFNRSNHSPPSNEARVTTSGTTQPPTAPRNLTAHPRDREVRLDWTPSNSDGGSPITKHQYRRKQGANGVYDNWEDIPSSAHGQTNATAFTVRGLTNGTSYTFQLRAKNNTNSNYSGESSPATTTPMASAQKPEAPTNLTADARNGGAYLTWVIGSNGGSPITEHQYRKKQGSGSYDNWTNIPSSASGQANVTSFTVTSLTNGTSYTFQVRAKNSKGESGASTDSPTVTPKTIPTAPTNFSANARDQGVYLTWATRSDGGSPITEHQYRKKQGSGSYENWTNILRSASGEANATSVTVRGLINGTNYTFQVRAKNSEGYSSVSSAVNVSPSGSAPKPPGAPRDLTANPRNGGIYLTWRAPSSDGGNPITKYQYRKKQTTANYDTWDDIKDSAPSGANNTKFMVTGLTNGTSYTLQLRAYNRAGGPGAVSTVTRIPMGNTPVPTPPRSLMASPRDTGAYLTWKTPFSDNGSAITHYEYQKRLIGVSSYEDWQQIPTSAPGGLNSTIFKVAGLNNDASYVFQIRAMSGSGGSTPSSEATVTPKAAFQAPTIPRNLMASPRNGGAYLTWKIPVSDGGKLITQYQYRRKQGVNSYDGWTDILRSAPSETHDTSFTVIGLSNDQAYTFQLRAVNATGNSEVSNEITATPKAASEVPQAPRLIVVHPRNTGAYLIWAPPTHDGGNPITKYQYRKKEDSNAYDNNWMDISRSAPGQIHERSYKVTGLTNDTIAYTFQMRAVNRDGKSSVSNEVVGVTPALVTAHDPGIPSLTVSPGDREVYFTWEHVNDGGSPVKYQYKKKSGGGNFGSTWTGIPGSAFGGIHETSYKVTGLINGTAYTFQLRAVSLLDQEGVSDEVSATPAAGPDAPGSLVPTSGNKEVSLAWTTPPNGGQPITKHQYWAAIEDWNIIAHDWTDITLSGEGEINVASFIVPNLNNGFEYKLKLRAVNDISNGAASDEVKFTPMADAATPSFQAEIKAVAGLAGTYKINPYKDISGLQSSGSYTIELTGSPTGITFNNASKTFSWNANATTQTLAGTIKHSSDPNETYNWDFNFTPITIPNTLSTESRNGKIVLSWLVKPGTTPTSFQYQEKTGTGAYDDWTTITNSGARGANRQSYTVTSTNGDLKTFKLRALDSSSSSILDYSESKGIAFQSLTNLTATTGEADPGTGGTRWVRLSWTRMTSQTIQNLVEKYALEVSLDGGTTWWTAPEFDPPSPSGNSRTVYHTYIGTETGQGETWKFRISAKTSSANGEVLSPPSSIVSISTSTFTKLDERITNGEIRLVGGTKSYLGVVQVGYKNSWRAICDDGWDANAAYVACRRAGYLGTTSTTNEGNHGILSSPLKSAYWLDDVKCDGSEDSLLDCSHATMGVHNCSLVEEVGVSCIEVIPSDNGYTIGPSRVSGF